MAEDDKKIPLPKFLQLLTNHNVPMPKAMAVAGKMYKEYNTTAKLAQVTEVKLSAAGVDSKDDRKLVMTALRKSGHVTKDTPRKRLEKTSKNASIAEPSCSSAVQAATIPTKKRRRTGDVNDLLPDGPVDEAATYGNLEFGEVMDEEILQIKSTVVNRAPVMMAWATVVAERIGFRREEALSIASVYTEMNAVTKGISLGIYQDGKDRGLEAAKGGSQSYVELLGRRVPLYRTQTDQWRALSNGSPVPPSNAFSYISRSFRQTTPYIIGALKHLAGSFTVQEINDRAWNLYAEFRPTVDQWGKRSEVKCSTILALRKKNPSPSADITVVERIIKFSPSETNTNRDNNDLPPEPKRTKGLTLEEYEAALDNNFSYDDQSLSL